MKISPVAQGAAAPIQSLNQTVSPSRVEAAKAAFLGQARIMPSDTPVDPQVARAQANIRAIKMRTNVSPDRAYEDQFSPSVENIPKGELDAQNGISDASSEAEPVNEVTKPLSPQFAALARQKRALQVKEREIQDRERALASQTSQSGGGDVLGRLKSNPLAVLQEAGVTYDQLTQAILANPSANNPDIQALRDELRATKEGFDKTLSERDAQAQREVEAEMRRNINRLVSTGEDFEMIRETGSQGDVTSLIKTIYKTEGVILDEAEAALLVEEELLKEAERIARIKKIQSRLAPAQSAPAEQVAPLQQPRQMRTLTSRDGTQPALSRRERMMRAASGQNN